MDIRNPSTRHPATAICFRAGYHHLTAEQFPETHRPQIVKIAIFYSLLGYEALFLCK